MRAPISTGETPHSPTLYLHTFLPCLTACRCRTMAESDKKISKNLANMKFMQRGAVSATKAKIEEKLENARDTHWVRGSIKASAEFVVLALVSLLLRTHAVAFTSRLFRALQRSRASSPQHGGPSVTLIPRWRYDARHASNVSHPAQQREKEQSGNLRKSEVAEKKEQIQAKQDDEDRELAARFVVGCCSVCASMSSFVLVGRIN